MIDRTQPNQEWQVANEGGAVPTWERVGIAVLMDIRRELRRLNAAIYCPNFVAVPRHLQRIARNTDKARKASRPRRKKASR